jgi:hypothetical protein
VTRYFFMAGSFGPHIRTAPRSPRNTKWITY